MNVRPATTFPRRRAPAAPPVARGVRPSCAGVSGQRGSVLVIVLWITLGLVTITLYFAHSMTLELRAADNRVAGLTADQAIEGAARYVSYVLTTWATNGAVPNLEDYRSQAVPVGDAHFWIIGRAGDYTSSSGQSQPNPTSQGDPLFFALIDEGSKLNVNIATASMLENLTNLTAELAANIVDWRTTNAPTSANGDGPTAYARLTPAYAPKSSPYETVEELRLVYGLTPDLLVGEDVNRNGVLDPDENDFNRNGVVDPGLLDCFTVYSREPNDSRTNVNTPGQLQPLLEQTLGTERAQSIMGAIRTPPTTFTSLLQFYIRSRMTIDEFAQVADYLTTTNATTIEGRINVNTASSMVLACVPGLTPDLAAQLVTYRQANPDKLSTVAWVKDALGQGQDSVANQVGPYLTTHSYQFTADIAALGPFGRGYQRTRFVFDTSEGTPKILYRRDLGQLGWALGKTIRQVWLAAKDTR